MIPNRARRNHYRHGGHPVEGCWKCQREYARCLSKITYPTRQAGEVVAVEMNERENYVNPVTQYPCDWGSKEHPHWHVAHCRNRRELKRARRKWRLWVAAAAIQAAGSVGVSDKEAGNE